MDVACKHCRAPVPDAVAKSEQKRVACPACGQIFRLTRRQMTAQVPRVTPRPASIDLVDTGDRLTLTWRWPATPGKLMAAISSALVVAYFYGLRSILTDDGGQVANAAVVGAMLLALIYLAVALCLNHTVISVDVQTLQVRHGPLPWPGKRHLPVSDISEVWCDLERTGDPYDASYQYDVRVRLRSQRVLVLLRGLNEADEAHFVKEQLERALRIPGSGI